jgi:hypothetical protein
MLIEEIEAYIDGIGSSRGGFGASEGDSEAPGAAPDECNGGREEGVDYSGTNNQESGVDEADLVKTDGYHVYALNGNRLHIYGVPEFGQLVTESVAEIEGHPTQMLLDSDAGKAAVFSMIPVYDLPEGHPLRALVGTQTNAGWFYRIDSLTKTAP